MTEQDNRRIAHEVLSNHQVKREPLPGKKRNEWWTLRDGEWRHTAPYIEILRTKASQGVKLTARRVSNILKIIRHELDSKGTN